MLGRAWRSHLDELGVTYEAPASNDCDLRQPAMVAKAITSRYRAVINCAAYTDVDGCETNEDHATAVNGIGVGALAQRCAELGIPVVHYSTDYVFDGVSTKPYSVDAPRRPLGAYGRSKALGEQLIEDAGGQHLIIRTSWLYAAWGRNFVCTIARLASERPTLRVVNDQRGRPTSVSSLVSASWRLLQSNASGIYHVADDGECTWFDLASEVVQQTGAACQVEPCTTAEFPRPACRPAYSVLDLSRTMERIGKLPRWQDALTQTLQCREPLNV
jgi:dTDP-4-dehydrorhamnose reductase